jgi:cyclophilin family peptidyl-prolyl cis-trans isomerase
MFFKKKIALFLTLLMSVSLCACNNAPVIANNSASETTVSDGNIEDDTQTEDSDEQIANILSDSDSQEDSDVDILNFTQPEIGEEIVVIKVKDYGTIKIKLFEDECPNGVENFKRLITEQNYYDNLTFHRVIKDFVIQGGDPNGNGTGGESIWGDGFEQEFNDGLRHFAGALAYATSSDHLNKSQFYIVCPADCSKLTDDNFESFSEYYGASYPENVIEKYREVGGVPYLDGGYQVFGQVFEGMDVVEAIQNVETDSNDMPLDDIIMESVTIEEYDGTSEED